MNKLMLGSREVTPVLAKGTHFKLFQHQWFDYELNDMAWLRSDTFSWQDGTVYSNAYNHLLNDIDGVSASTETVGGYTVTFYRAADGHKIVLADQETTVGNIYTATGVAWYYVLDTANNRFKLPRTKYGFDGLRGNVGDYVAESLPNITGDTITRAWTNSGGSKFVPAASSSGAFSVKSVDNHVSMSGGSAYSIAIYEGDMDASRSSSAYQNGAPVQQRGTQMYLYFYVGQFTQTAIEQTAGLNAELFNGKADRDLSNLSATGRSAVSDLLSVNETYDDLTLGASGTKYTAPANGWFALCKSYGSGSHYISMRCLTSDDVELYGDSRASTYQMGGRLFLKVKKGNKVEINYDATGVLTYFRFFYDEGVV